MCGWAGVEPATPGFAVRLALNARRLSCNVYINRHMTNPTKWLCAQRRLRSAWATAQSDQSLRCPHEETLGPQLPFERTAKALIRLGECPGWSESSLGAKAILLVLSWGGSHSESISICISSLVAQKFTTFWRPSSILKAGLSSAIDSESDCRASSRPSHATYR